MLRKPFAALVVVFGLAFAGAEAVRAGAGPWPVPPPVTCCTLRLHCCRERLSCCWRDPKPECCARPRSCCYHEGNHGFCCGQPRTDTPASAPAEGK